ncbi:hypothetical protein PM082_024084 [Marasmius tenuissimus]|nr:hypothetical protein PM082_024084 [Marasmius tenuissimus]
MDDIWDSPFWWGFPGPDGENFVRGGGPDKLRLPFGLGMDGFNPYGSKQAKQVRQPTFFWVHRSDLQYIITSTAIYMVLYNLLPHLQYHPKNIYLLLEFWEGVFFT